MRKYTAKEKQLLEKNQYTYKVTDHKLLFTAEFKKEFWKKYEAGMAPREILTDLGYDTDMFGQKQIDSMVQSIKKQAAEGVFREGLSRTRQRSRKVSTAQEAAMTEENWALLWNEVQYLRQEVDAIKRLRPAGSVAVHGTER